MMCLCACDCVWEVLRPGIPSACLTLFKCNAAFEENRCENPDRQRWKFPGVHLRVPQRTYVHMHRHAPSHRDLIFCNLEHPWPPRPPFTHTHARTHPLILTLFKNNVTVACLCFIYIPEAFLLFYQLEKGMRNNPGFFVWKLWFHLRTLHYQQGMCTCTGLVL